MEGPVELFGVGAAKGDETCWVGPARAFVAVRPYSFLFESLFVDEPADTSPTCFSLSSFSLDGSLISTTAYARTSILRAGTFHLPRFRLQAVSTTTATPSASSASSRWSLSRGESRVEGK
jgi:hypothetical protein